MKCECGAHATGEVYNGRDTLPICEACYTEDETIWMEAVIAFNMDVMHHQLTGQSFAELRVHPTFDAEAVLSYYLMIELELRDMTPDDVKYRTLIDGAITRYDEWYATKETT